MRIPRLFGCLLLVSAFAAPATGVEPLSNKAAKQVAQLDNAWRSGVHDLMDAARDNKLDKLRASIAKGVDVNARPNGNGMTAVMEAASQGYVEAMDILLSAGADPSVEMWNGWTALAFAARNGRTAAIERLLRARPAPTAKHLQLALFAASEAGRPKTSAVLVGAGADVNAFDASGLTPLMLAAKWGQPKTASKLIALGAKIDARDRMGQTALMWAARQGRSDVVSMLLDAGADVGLKDKRGMAAFPGGAAPQDRAAQMRRQWSRVKARPKSCPALLGYGVVAKGPSGPIVVSYGLYRRPARGAAARLVPIDGGPVIPVAIGKTSRAETDGGLPEWNATLEAKGPLGKVPERGQRTGMLLWPAPEGRLRLVTPKPAELPYGLSPEAVEAAVDIDGDRKADALSLQYCCKDPTRADKCEYYCRDYWQRDAGEWRRCQSSGPA